MNHAITAATLVALLTLALLVAGWRYVSPLHSQMSDLRLEISSGHQHTANLLTRHDMKEVATRSDVRETFAALKSALHSRTASEVRPLTDSTNPTTTMPPEANRAPLARSETRRELKTKCTPCWAPALSSGDVPKPPSLSDIALTNTPPTDKIGGAEYEFPDAGHRVYSRGSHGYEWFFEPARNDNIRFLEIGMDRGASAMMWREFFPNAELYGMDFAQDMLDNALGKADGGITIFKGDQANPAHLEALIADTGANFNVIVDDGGHAPTQQINSFKKLFKDALKPGGLYTVEDVEMSYWTKAPASAFPNVRGGVGKPGTWMEISKLFIDTINRPFHDESLRKSVFENGADADIDVMFVAKNWMAFVKKGSWDKKWDQRSYLRSTTEHPNSESSQVQLEMPFTRMERSILSEPECRPCIRQLHHSVTDQDALEGFETAADADGVVNGYGRWYQWFLSDVKQLPLRVLEIGRSDEAAWRRFLPVAEVFRFDMNKAEGKNEFLGDPARPEDLRNMLEASGGQFDVIVDTGSHVTSQQIAAFGVLFKAALRPGGYYFVEGTATSYWSQDNGGLGKAGTWVETSKVFFDTIQRVYHDRSQPRQFKALETGADAMIDVMAVARNWMGFVKKGSWAESWDTHRYVWMQQYGAGLVNPGREVDSVPVFPGERPIYEYDHLKAW